MAQTIFGLNDPKAVKRWSAALMVDQAREGYFSTRFMGKGENAMTPFQILTNLERDAGDTIKFDLSAQLRNEPVYGDNRQEGTEEDLRFLSDQVQIDQVRGGVNAGGRMTRKRILHDLRSIAKQRMAEWWARWHDEMCFSYLSGARGINPDYIHGTGFTGFAGNAFQAPDARHLLFGGNATATNNIGVDDKFDLALIDRAVTKAETMGGGSTRSAELRPIRIEGEDRYVIVMHSFQAHDLRTNSSVGQWMDIQKAAAGAEGQRNPIFKGALGMYRGAILHSHKAAVRFNNWGADSLQPGARALFMGRQAGVMAYGSPGSGLRYDWHEETRDNGNEVVISTSTICGVKKTRFNGEDFGLLALDTYAADPNPA